MNIKVKSTIKDPREIGTEKLNEFIAKKAMEWENSVKSIVRGEGEGGGKVDTGRLLNSFYTEINESGFIGATSVEYAKYLEYGAVSHFVPWFGKSGKPILAKWGKRVGFSKEEMESGGGLFVKTPEIAMMRRSLARLCD